MSIPTILLFFREFLHLPQISGARGKRSYCRRGQAASGGCHLKGIFDLLCEHFIGNSSDTYFSWTYFGRGHIHIPKEGGLCSDTSSCELSKYVLGPSYKWEIFLCNSCTPSFRQTLSHLPTYSCELFLCVFPEWIQSQRIFHTLCIALHLQPVYIVTHVSLQRFAWCHSAGTLITFVFYPIMNNTNMALQHLPTRAWIFALVALKNLPLMVPFCVHL